MTARKSELPSRTDSRLHFTAPRLRDLPPAPLGRRDVYWHDAPPELALRVTASGAKTFYAVKRVGRRMEWFRIGRFPSCDLGTAETRAKDLIGEVARGHNPGEDRRRGAAADVTLREFCERFLDEYAAPNVSPGALCNWEILVRRHVLKARKPRAAGAWREVGGSKHGDVRLSRVDQEWVARLQASIAPKAGSVRRRTANQCVVMLRRAFTVASELWGWDLPHGNPAQRVPLFRDAERDAQRVRYLTTDELGRLFKALSKEEPEARLIVLLALVTGQRRGNVLSARWDAIDLDRAMWTIRHAPRAGTTTKGRRDHAVVLPPVLVGLLREWQESQPQDATWVFPAESDSGHVTDFKGPWRRIVAAAKLADFRFHDLRHSCATLMLAAGAPLPLIGSQLGHRSAESTARYAHVQLEGQRAAVAAAAAALPAGLLNARERGPAKAQGGKR